MGETEYSKTKSGPSPNLKVGIIPTTLNITIQVNCKYCKWSMSVQIQKFVSAGTRDWKQRIIISFLSFFLTKNIRVFVNMTCRLVRGN